MKKCPEKRSKIQTKCAHAPWASYNTPQIELTQYGRRIGKKVYCSQQKGKEICHSGLLKGPKGPTDAFYGCENLRNALIL